MNDSYLFGKYVSACYGMNWFETRMYQFGILKYLIEQPLIQLGPNCCNTYMEGSDANLEKCWENDYASGKFEKPESVPAPAI